MSSSSSPDPLSCLAFQPVREPFVELGAILVGEAAVRGQLNEDVAEAECLRRRGGAADGCDELLGLQGLEVPVDERDGLVGDQCRHRLCREVEPDDRCTVQQVLFGGSEPIQSGG